MMNKNPNQYLESDERLYIGKLKVRTIHGDGCHLGMVFITFIFGIMSFTASYSDISDIYIDYIISQNQEVIDADVYGECKRSTVTDYIIAKSKSGFVRCDFLIKYDGINYKKGFSFVDFSTENYYSSVAVQHKDNPSLVTVDISLEKIPSRVFSYLVWMLLGLGLPISSVYLMIKRLKVVYFKYEINRNAQLALFLIATGLWEKENKIRYYNVIRGKKIKMSYGGVIGNKASHPYFIRRKNRDYVLIV